jgi:hypothetical protein
LQRSNFSNSRPRFARYGAKAKGNEKLARKLVFGKLKYTGPEASFSSSHASVMKALDECFHVIVGKAADEIDKTRELLKELKREV